FEPGEPGLVDAGEPGLEALVLRSEDLSDQVGPGRVWNGACHQSHRAVDEDPGRLTLGIAVDLAVRRGLRVGRDPGATQCLGVGPAGVTIDPGEPDRPIRSDRVQSRPGGEFAPGPEGLVPVVADDPGVA